MKTFFLLLFLAVLILSCSYHVVTGFSIEDPNINKSTLRRNLLNIPPALILGNFIWGQIYAPPGFKRIFPTQFIAALDDPAAHSGNSAKKWGIWEQDPGPRGVFLKKYQQDIVNRNGIAPAGWIFNPNDWWLEEHGLIMESPTFPLNPGRYLVTGGRSVTTGLTIDNDGNWKLDDEKATLYDVTHLPCRSARYSPIGSGSNAGSPLTANQKDFPVKPGAEMPKVDGCNKQDYAVLFVIGVESA